MAPCDRGVQSLLALAFSLMSVAIGTDYWLYSRASVCNGSNISSMEDLGGGRGAGGDLTHSGLWRVCCLEGRGTRVRGLWGKSIVLPF